MQTISTLLLNAPIKVFATGRVALALASQDMKELRASVPSARTLAVIEVQQL